MQADFEARRRARWGKSARAAPGGPAVGGARYGAGQRDYLGYYAMLGLDAAATERVSEGDVKKAFREAALRWHPDRQKVWPTGTVLMHSQAHKQEVFGKSYTAK